MSSRIARLIALMFFVAFPAFAHGAQPVQAQQGTTIIATPEPERTEIVVPSPEASASPELALSPSPATSASPQAPTAPSATPSASPSPAQPFTLTGKHVTYYSDIYAVSADDNVAVRLADGTRITGNTFTMNLKLNRFVIAGNVHIHTKDGQDLPGAAFAEFFDFHRAYFVPITEEQPDRWTYLDNDFAHPLPGRMMPGDTFFLPDLGKEHVFLYGSQAVITPRESISFTPAFVNLNFLANKAPIYVPTPNYFFTFSANPNFAQNSLAGAYFDAPYPFLGGAHGSASVHLRYDELNKLYASYEQHLAITDHSYAVFSVNPLTRPQKSYNLLAMDHLSPNVQAEFFAQENAFQHNLSQPLSAGAFTKFKATIGLRRSFVQISEDQLWQSLLADPAPLTYYGDAFHNWVPDHGSDAQITWTGFTNRVHRHQPLLMKLRSGMGFVHDSYIVPAAIGGVAYPTLWQHFVGATFYTPALQLKTPPFRDWYFNAVIDKQRQWYSAPHFVDTTNTTLSLSKTFDKHFSMFVSYHIVNTGDFYGAQQSLAYPSQIPFSPVTRERYPAYAAFRGFGTTRSLSETAIWSPSSNLTLNLTWRENHDFPTPIPYLDAPLGFLQTLGYLQQGDIGVSPQQLTADLRVRLRPNLLVNLGRSYYFNWANRRWAPQFTILVTK